MTDAQIEAGTLEANLDDRTLSGLLVPFNELGRTNLGRFIVSKGVLAVPKDPSIVTLNVGHDRETPVGRAVLLAEQDDGIHATFKFADTPEADAALLDFEAGTRSKLSVEAKGMKISNGKATAGAIFGAALVAKGAFASATLMAEDVGETTEHHEDEYTDANGIVWRRVSDTSRTTTTTDTGVTQTTSTTTVTEESPTTQEVIVTVPSTLEATEEIKPSGFSFAQVMGILDAVASKSADSTMLAALAEVGPASEDTLFAALTDIKLTTAGSIGVNSGMLQPQWIGELKDLVKYRQRFLPLFAHEALKSFTINGFEWTTEFAGADWGGDKGAIPSNAPQTAAYTTAAARFGGAWDVAREFRDFNVPGFWEALYKQSAKSYFKWADNKVAAAAIASATTLEADNPAGLTIGAGWSALIDGAVALVTAEVGVPEFALVAPALYKSMLKTPADNVLGYLNAALGLEDGTIEHFTVQPYAGLAAGNVLTGVGEAVTVYELPGVPIRAEGLDMTKGGIDPGLFGYLATVIEDDRGLQLVTPYTP
jgi:hypothetical protein